MSRYRTTMAEALQKVYETPQGFALVSKAKEIAKKFANNMSKAVAEIEKLEKGLSKNSSVRDALQKANEELEEGKMKDIFTADKEGESAAEIAKKLKLPLATVKKILGEATIEIKEFTSDMIKRLKKSYSTMPQRISTAQADALSRHLDRLDLVSLKQLAKEKIPFITTLARNKIYRKTGKFEEFLKEEDHEISMARGELEAIADKAIKLSGALQGKSEAEGLEAWVQSKITKAKDYINSVADYMEYTPDLGEETDPDKIALAKEKDTDALEAQLTTLKGQVEVLKQKLENEKNKAVKPIPNPETGEVPLTIGLAHKLLKDKDEKEAKEKKQKENSNKIKALAKGEKLESFTRKYLQYLNITESEIGDKAKAMGLDYMSFGRYGKDGKVTHKSIGGNLTAVDKDEKPIKEPTKKPDAPKKDTTKVKEVEPIEVKSKKFLQSLEAGKIEDDNGTVELDFDDEGSFEAAAEKARSMGLDDVADDIDSIGGYVMEMEPEKAQAEYQDMMSKYSGKPVKALEFSKQADEAIGTIADQTYTDDPAPFADDLLPVLSIMKQMVDSDETEGNVGSGMSNPSKGFRPEVIGTLQSVSDIVDHAAQLEDEYKGKNTKVKEILANIQGELNFIMDENEDHDNYTKSHKVNSAIDSTIQLAKDLHKEMKKETKNEEADLSKPQIKKVHKMADELPKKDFKDRYGKEKGDSVRYATATNIVKKKEGIKEQMRLRIESMAALKKKADKSGMPYSILKKVFDRGMAAWKGGHRPGASQHQWAYARVNSFVTKSSGTWGGADKDLAAKVRGSK